MTFRTSKEAPAGNHIPAGENTAFFGGKSVNRVDPIDTDLSYRGRKNGLAQMNNGHTQPTCSNVISLFFGFQHEVSIVFK